MRYPPEHKEAARKRIIEAAGRLFCSNGISATGVDTVMSAVGLTAGGFYNHFKTKNALVAEVVTDTLRANRELLTRGLDEDDPAKWIEGFMRRYLSRKHRDAPESGCPIAAMSSELANVEETHAGTHEEIETYAQLLAQKLDPRGEASPRQRALAMFAMMVGAISLARCLRGGALSDEILRSCRAVGAP